MKRIFVLLLATILFIQIFSLSVFAEDTQTGILAELEGATVGGVAFDVDDYPKESGAAAELLAFMERDYRFDANQSSYRMEVYIYNPSETAIVSGGKNTIEMAVKFDEKGVAESYEKFSLKFLEKTENNRFYKFAVVDHVSAHDGNKIVQRVDRAARRYTVSEFEVQYIGIFNGTASPVGKSFVFTGYQSEKNLSVSTGLVETIELDVHQTYWRSQTSSLGIGHQNQLNTAYFSVPNEYLMKYGALQKIKAEWNEQKTEPVFFTTNDVVYDAVYPYLGMEVGEHNENVPFSLYAGKTVTSYEIVYDWTYNVKEFWGNVTVHSLNICEKLPYCFKAVSDETGAVAVPGEELRTYIQKQNYADWLFADSVDDGRKKGYQIQEIAFDQDELLDMESYGSTHSWWRTFWNYTIKDVDAYEEFGKIAPIYDVKSTDIVSKTNADISSSLYIAQGDVEELRSVYADAVANDETLFLFRFAATDYYSDACVYETGSGTVTGSKIAQETVFLGFDIISLTFYKDGVSTVIPVISDPDDVIDDLTNPILDDKLDLSWLKRLVMLIAVLVLIIVCWHPLLMMADALMGLVHNVGVDVQNMVKKRGKRK